MPQKPTSKNASGTKDRFSELLRKTGERHQCNDIVEVEFPAVCGLQSQLNLSFLSLPPAEKKEWLFRFVKLYLKAAGRKRKRREALAACIGNELAEYIQDSRLMCVIYILGNRLDCCFKIAEGKAALLFSVRGEYQALTQLAGEMEQRFKINFRISLGSPGFLPVTVFPFKFD